MQVKRQWNAARPLLSEYSPKRAGADMLFVRLMIIAWLFGLHLLNNKFPDA